MDNNTLLKIKQLRAELEEHNYNYYVKSSPTISDFEFDKKMKELQDLEKSNPEFFDPNSPTQRVGNDINKAFKQVKHIYPMLSLGNTYSKEEVSEFYNRISKTLNEPFEIVCELKFDGTSVSLIYENGELLRAVTRGDGEKGDDITDNIRTIRSIPLRLQKQNIPDFFEIRGEILMPWNVFERLNKEREKDEEPLFANPRNATSGTIKLQNSAEVAKRNLDAYLYYLLGEDMPSDSHYQNLQTIKQWGFKVSEEIAKCKNLNEIFDFIDKWDIERKKLPVATDGIVLKVDSLKQQQMLGLTSKSPRWAIAYKFQAEQAETRLNSVSYQVGRTGAITPVANLDPVLLSGTIVKRASLHNADIIKDLDLHIGDMVYVEKGGEIIPKIVGVNKDARILIGEKIDFIKRCPECGTPLIRKEGEAAHYCPNEDTCAPQIKGKIEHFISRKAMAIESLGEETINLLYNQNLVKNCADLYKLTEENIAPLERMGEKSAQKIITNIQKSKNVPFERVLFALGIRYVGETVAKKLAYSLHNIDALENASFEELKNIDEIGEKIAESIVNFFKEEKNKQLVNDLKQAGLKFAIDEKTLQNKTDKLNGKTIVISGTFSLHSREEYKEIIVNNGGKNTSSISSKTDFILAGENMGPSKLQKAQELSIKILSEEEFLSLLK
ncbi:MAG: NAD-dependent DNA ligase LigA [Paludibacteraceae bacterium]|nr:NAD-dependent DNA ligase LigA [Paludibacteraceae bacterium]